MSAFPAASDSHHHRHSDSRCLPRRHLDSMLAYHPIIFSLQIRAKRPKHGSLKRFQSQGKMLKSWQLTLRRAVYFVQSKGQTVSSSGELIATAIGGWSMIEDHRVTQFSLSLTRFHLFASANLHPRLQTMEWATRSASVREKTKTKTRSASVREKRDDTCLFWGAACRLVAGPWLLVWYTLPHTFWQPAALKT